jgi:hypothetical protein
MKTKLNMTDDCRSQKLNETLVRDSKQLKVKTNIRGGYLKITLHDGN